MFTAAPRALAGAAIATIGWIGFDLLLDFYGARTIIARALPVMEAFLPAIGFGLLAGIVSAAAIWIRGYFRSRAKGLVKELRGFVKAVEWDSMGLMDDLHPFSGTGVDADVLADKLAPWLPQAPRGVQAIHATWCAAVLDAHGWRKGRRMILHRLKSQTQEPD